MSIEMMSCRVYQGKYVMAPPLWNWAIVHSYDGKGKPEGCLETCERGLKRKAICL